MKHFLRVSAGLCALCTIILLSGYFLDHHRCKGINYEQAGYELPRTWLISAKQCFDAANSVKLRGYARHL